MAMLPKKFANLNSKLGYQLILPVLSIIGENVWLCAEENRLCCLFTFENVAIYLGAEF